MGGEALIFDLRLWETGPENRKLLLSCSHSLLVLHHSMAKIAQQHDNSWLNLAADRSSSSTTGTPMPSRADIKRRSICCMLRFPYTQGTPVVPVRSTFVAEKTPNGDARKCTIPLTTVSWQMEQVQPCLLTCVRRTLPIGKSSETLPNLESPQARRRPTIFAFTVVDHVMGLAAKRHMPCSVLLAREFIGSHDPHPSLWRTVSGSVLERSATANLHTLFCLSGDLF